MTNKFLLVIILFTLLNGCKKDNPQPEVIVTSSGYRITSASPGTNYDDFIIYPNPASNEVNIHFQNSNANSNCTIKVIAGKYSETVYNKQSSGDDLTIDLINFPKGVALIQVVIDSKLWEYNLIIQ